MTCSSPTHRGLWWHHHLHTEGYDDIITYTQKVMMTSSPTHRRLWWHHHLLTEGYDDIITYTQRVMMTLSLTHKELWWHHHLHTEGYDDIITYTQRVMMTSSPTHRGYSNTRLCISQVVATSRYTTKGGMTRLKRYWKEFTAIAFFK